MISLISGVFLGSIYWAVCFSKQHWINIGIFGVYGQFFNVPLYLKAIFQISGKTQIWQFNHISLWNLLCWSILVDFRVTQMMPTSFIVCGHNFGELSLLRCPSPKKHQIQPRRQKTAHWAAKWSLSRKAEALKVFSGYGCDMFPHNWVCPDPKNWGIVGVARKNNQFQGRKKTKWENSIKGTKNACSDSMWLWKANRPVYGT